MKIEALVEPHIQMSMYVKVCGKNEKQKDKNVVQVWEAVKNALDSLPEGVIKTDSSVYDCDECSCTPCDNARSANHDAKVSEADDLVREALSHPMLYSVWEKHNPGRSHQDWINFTSFIKLFGVEV